MSNSKRMFFGGVPTELDIKTLRNRYPDNGMNAGDFIGYEELEGLLGLTRDTYRFKTVVSRWRKIVEAASGRILGAVPGEGLKVLKEGEKVDLSRAKLRSSSRLARRSLVVLARTDRKALTAQELAFYDHQQETGAKILAAAQIKRKIEMPQMVTNRGIE